MGPHCKITTRSFSGTGWAWLAPLPPCKPSLISLSFLTTKDTAILLYSGPLSKRSSLPPSEQHSFSPPANITHYLRGKRHRRAALALQLVRGRIQVVVQAPAGQKLQATVNSTQPLNDGIWHDVHLRLMDKVGTR